MRVCVRGILTDSFMRYVTYDRQKHAGLLGSHRWAHKVLIEK